MRLTNTLRRFFAPLEPDHHDGVVYRGAMTIGRGARTTPTESRAQRLAKLRREAWRQYLRQPLQHRVELIEGD